MNTGKKRKRKFGEFISMKIYTSPVLGDSLMAGIITINRLPTFR
jgi:hypothetical protein